MKKTVLSATLCSATLFLAAARADAPKPAPAAAPVMDSAQADLLKRYDTNHDGKLDEEERAAMREQLKADAKAGKFKN